MSWVRVWVHFVFSTKNFHKILKPQELRSKLFNHILENAKQKEIFIDSLNGFEDHVHCLISLSKDLSISKTIQLIKGESSHWFNHQDFGKKLVWQDDYWAVGVSESHIEDVRNYIKSQEEHHRRITFEEEVNNFMKKYGWVRFKDKK